MIQNHLSKLILSLILFVNSSVFAQLDLPRGSQRATVTQRVGITDISISYSRPSVNGREIWGKLVPYGMNNLGFGTAKESPWRAGADENTTISFTDDVSIEGKPLKAGIYGLHMIIYEDGKATIIFSNNSTAWGSFFYEPSEDALRVEVQTGETPFTEQLTYDFINVDATSATAVLNWEKKQIPFKISVDVNKVVMANIREKLQNQEGFQRQTWEQAAGYALNNGGDLNEALGWINNAIAGQFYSQETFNNLQIKSQILDKMGKPNESKEAMDKALTLATIFETHQYGRTLIAQGKKEEAMKVFKMNAEKHKDTWPVDVGLARGYSAMGDYNKALKHLRIALTRVPDPANKTAIEDNITKLEKGQDIN